MLAPSKTRFALPEVLSTKAGIRPLAACKEDQRSTLVDCKDGFVILTVDLKKPWLLLLVLAELELVDVVLKP